MIYFAQQETGGPIKIGFTSKDPVERLRELNTGNHEALVLLRAEPGGQESEKRLHKQFSHHRLRGEWFKPGMDLMKRIVFSEDDVEVAKLKSHASSYMNCLWSHCVCENVNKPLVDFLYIHAQWVCQNVEECWAFLGQRGVEEVGSKHCQYFFALAWPVFKPWRELSIHVIKQLVGEGMINEHLPFDSMKANQRPVCQEKYDNQLYVMVSDLFDRCGVPDLTAGD